MSRRNKLASYSATYRLAARPYALSKVFGAAGRTQFATIHHVASAVKTVQIRMVEVAIESATAAAIITADLVRISTAPATGNPAITPTSFDPDIPAAEATCLALPTSAGTEGALYATGEWNLGITAAASTQNPPPPLIWQTIYNWTNDETRPAVIRPGTLEGFAVVFDSNAAVTINGLVIVTFTEETEA